MSSAEPDDHELIELITRGDQNAADIFVDRYKRLIYSILKRDYRLSDDVPDDLFQEVFARLWEDNYRRLRKWRRLGPFTSYLAIVVHNVARDYLRSQRQTMSESPRVGASPFKNSGDPAEDVLVNEIRCSVRGALDKLKPRDRELLRLKYDHDWSYKEIAAEMGLTVNQVGVSLCRAEARLREILYEKFPDLFPNDEEHV